MNIKFDCKATILIVDDDSTILELLSEFFEATGFEVLAAQSGRNALELAKTTLPGLILLDVLMPEIDGFETYNQLKENPITKDIPVIFTTAFSDTNNKVKGLELGAVDYITKPFQLEELLARVQLQLKLHGLRKKLADRNLLLEQRLTEKTEQLN